MVVLLMLVPATAYNGVDQEYLKKGNNFNHLRSKYYHLTLIPSRILNMMLMIGTLLAVFFFSLLEPTWEYNWKVFLIKIYLA